MSDNVQTISLTIRDAETIRDGLLQDPPRWPDTPEVDCAGVQVIAAALRAGLTPPDHIRDNPEVNRLWAALHLDDVLPLSS